MALWIFTMALLSYKKKRNKCSALLELARMRGFFCFPHLAIEFNRINRKAGFEKLYSFQRMGDFTKNIHASP
jgi:hypothetical protein